MPDDPTGTAPGSSARSEPEGDSATWEPEVEQLDEAECWRLISAGGVGRLAYSGRFGLTVLPAIYKVHEGSIVFRIALGSPTDEDLRTGIRGAEYRVAVEIDEVGKDAQEGWFVFIQGAAHHVDSDDDRASVAASGVQPWAAGTREHFVRITPTLITGRRIRQH
ncbi:MAG TPA: pyridoxamine 5'-phosphate oxidase family protein [Streptosporangiaceae bacterium]|jgi:nitroimidazol reductase NimA-like FMN-containing flavoprotein (pyridoxamine 5'-phosphate oxidase superfamily)